MHGEKSAVQTMSHSADAYFHVRVLIGLVTGLGLTRLLNGLSRFVQHPSRTQIHPAHLAWTLFMLIYIIHFWWFEFGLSVIERWEFEHYAFVIGYAALLFFITTLLFPDRMEDYSGFAEYFTSRAGWFFALLALVFVVDMLDTLVKGRAHFTGLGPWYPVRQIGLAMLCCIAIFIRNGRLHLVFGLIAILAELWWIGSKFRFL
ncbi:hypothetical protein SAMN06295998_101384 [Primorskyibacter flagellatus]|uniref:Uncharacterized protein n=2 Tax=Primorskyibacter flagellatus TaxID=1387277 RepID=A0A1W1ZA52_9RHOB|nr:hypothetical protein SAMN06295998_101384 [Primorskyibacter flagellatus]